MARIEASCVGKTKTACCQDVKATTTIVIGCGADIISVGGVGRPQCTDSRVIVNERLGAKRRKRHHREIKMTIDLVIHQDEGIATGETKEVER